MYAAECGCVARVIGRALAPSALASTQHELRTSFEFLEQHVRLGGPSPVAFRVVEIERRPGFGARLFAAAEAGYDSSKLELRVGSRSRRVGQKGVMDCALRPPLCAVAITVGQRESRSNGMGDRI